MKERKKNSKFNHLIIKKVIHYLPHELILKTCILRKVLTVYLVTNEELGCSDSWMSLTILETCNKKNI